ncbi:alkaline phosphatase [Fervidicella metallireducens AeB]|uniref:Alkaline phosphatase n=1 Tax=Fervidicella metallireducens AeB TaxID=1403537 RepID=A0A017RZL3_9CLOT|nr:LTA synthase family protein [Fervidicella metallireducens]EYE89380.1 alkaline phosphatase [Fervidicella metallireducens AeB]
MKKIAGLCLNSIDVFVFIALMLIKLISFNYAIKLPQVGNINLILGCLGSVMVISSLGCFFNQKRRFKFLLISDFVISFILMSDLVYNRYFLDVTSVALIKQARLVGEVKDSVAELFKLKDLIYFIDIILILPFHRRIKAKLQTVKPNNFKRRIALITVLLVTGYSLSYNSASALEREMPGLLRTLYDKKFIVTRIGNLNFHFVDFYRYISNNVLKKEKLSEEEKNSVKQWYENKNNSESSVTSAYINQKISKENSVIKRYTGIAEGKNLIVVQLEAFQSFVLNRKINGQEITPNLNKLMKDCLVFDNYYYQTAWGGTSDAEFLSNTSLLPAREGSVYYQYSGNKYESLVSHLKDKGYFTAVMHANRPAFWNRTNMYASLGFEKYESEPNFVIDDKQGLGLSDKSFFNQAITKMTGYKQPFYTFLITLSSHFPYKDSANKIKDILDVGDFEGTTMGDYLKSVKYTDEAIGEFVESLKKQGLWDNSIVVFYGDHAAIPYDKRDLLAKLLYNKNDLTPYEWITAQKVVAMIHIPGEKIKGHNSMAAGQYDLYPTLANFYGFNPMYSLGRDLLNSKNGFVVNRNGVWLDNNVIYLSNVDKVVELKTGKELDKQDYSQEFDLALKYLKNSDATIEHNLIKEFLK